MSKRAIPNVLTLLASCHVHADLRKDNWWQLLEICFNQKHKEQTTLGKKKGLARTSNWDGMGFLVGSGLTVVHFFLSWELTSTTRLSFAHLRQKDRNWVSGIGLNCFAYQFTSCPQVMPSRFCNTHVCLALAEQYFLFLSASLSWPFLQHWPQTNIIFRFGGPNLLCALESCWWHLKDWLNSVCLMLNSSSKH